jgi:hypothetical protein
MTARRDELIVFAKTSKPEQTAQKEAMSLKAESLASVFGSNQGLVETFTNCGRKSLWVE